MSDYFDLLELELRAAVARAAAAGAQAGGRRPGQAPRRTRLRPGILPAALGAAATLLVVGLAIGTLGHVHKAPTRPQPTKPNSASTPNTPAAGSTLRELTGSFAILGRPETAADRSWRPPASALHGVREVPSATRLARTLPNGDRVFLTVEQVLIPQPGRPKGSYAMDLWVVGRGGDFTTTTLFGAGGSYTVLPLQFPAPNGAGPALLPGDLVWTSVVPNGIGTVRWTFECNQLMGACAGRNAINLSVPVHNNVATGQMQSHNPCDATSASCVQPATVTWYGAGTRQVVARYDRTSVVTAPPGLLRTPAPPVNGVPPRPADEILSGGGIASIHFGTQRGAAVGQLDRLLRVRGAPRSAGDCGVNSSVAWTLRSGQPPLTAYFGHGRLVGYQYGSFADQAFPLPTAYGPMLGTTRGLTIGDTLDVGRRLYGREFTSGPVQGGSWKLITASGPIDGYLSGVPQRGKPPRVVTIDAGNVGCPAVSP